MLLFSVSKQLQAKCSFYSERSILVANCSKQGIIITGCYGECTSDVFL